MIGKLIECEADKNNKYYRVIHDEEYRDGIFSKKELDSTFNYDEDDVIKY